MRGAMIAPAYAELRRLLAEEVSPAPWTSELGSGDTHWIEREDGKPIGEFASWSDNEFIAAMRNALPQLLAEAEAGRKLRATIGEAVAWNTVAATAPGACADYDREVGT